MFRSPRAYWRSAAFGHVGLLEAYFAGELDIEGSLARRSPPAWKAASTAATGPSCLAAQPLARAHAFERRALRARANAEAHYALPPEFYKFWLDDPLMLYTCAYWTEGTRTLEEAQRNKCDHVARKLLLKPGEEVIDVGSGFGGFMFHAHERYGVKVTAVNTTGSQAEHARREIERKRLGDCALHADARGLPRRRPATVRQGGLHRLPRARRARPARRAHPRSCGLPQEGGIGLIHFIGHVGRFDTDFFIRKYVFPGGWIPSLADVIVEMEKPASKCSTSRTCAATTRSRSTCGPSASTGTGTRSARSTRSASTSASGASGACISTAAPRCSARRTAARTSSRSCSPRATSRARATR